MPNCDFYALEDDYRQVLDFVFAGLEVEVWDLSSELDEPLRRFSSSDEVLSTPQQQNCQWPITLHLYAPAAKGQFLIEETTLNTGQRRSSSTGWGLIQLYLGAVKDGRLHSSHTNHNSEVRARNWSHTSSDSSLGDPGAWDWSEVTRVSRRLNYRIRRLGVRKEDGRAILPGADSWLRTSEGAVLGY